MSSGPQHTAPSPLDIEPLRENLFSPADVETILPEHGWLAADAQLAPETRDWLARAAAYLGPHCADRAALASLLSLIFCYNAAESLALPASHAVLTREGARDVIRELAREILGGESVDSDRFKAIIESLKSRVISRSRHLFHPIRLALAGRAGEGELDRVILLLDSAASAPGLAPVKSTRQRMLEFCAALN